MRIAHLFLHQTRSRQFYKMPRGRDQFFPQVWTSVICSRFFYVRNNLKLPEFELWRCVQARPKLPWSMQSTCHRIDWNLHIILAVTRTRYCRSEFEINFFMLKNYMFTWKIWIFSPDNVGDAVAKIIKIGKSGQCWVSEDNQAPYLTRSEVVDYKDLRVEWIFRIAY